MTTHSFVRFLSRFGLAASGICATALLAGAMWIWMSGGSSIAAPPETKAAVASGSSASGGKAPAVNLPPQVLKINEAIRRGWEEKNVKPAPPATESEWCRRVYLDVLGRIPSYQEMNAHLANTSPARRVELINQLLDGETYTEEFARNWTTIWTNILIGRSAGTERNSMVNREGMQKFIRDSFARNKPYNDFVYELVTATGSNTPGAENFNGAVNFLTNKLEEKAAQATAETSKIFLGMQVQCTQCHNHPFNEWKQKKFWEMNAFFRQTTALRRFKPGTRDIMGVELANEDFAGEGSNSQEAEIYYELRNAQLKVAYPTFVDGTEIGRSGHLSDVNRRNELGKLIVNSPFMGQALVNRLWSHFLGYGFTKPIDDMGPHNGPTHPDLLQYLGEEFREHSYSVKDVMRWIVLSEPYALASKITASNKIDDPSVGEKPLFSRFYLRQMQAEQLYESLLVATQAHKTRGSFEEEEKQKSEWLQQFVNAFGTDEGDESTSFNGSIPQALMMFNGDLMKKATDGAQGSFLHTIAHSKLRPQQQIDYLFMAALGRRPNSQELQAANALLGARKGDPVAALQDVWWVVLNTNEFILNH